MRILISRWLFLFAVIATLNSERNVWGQECAPKPEDIQGARIVVKKVIASAIHRATGDGDSFVIMRLNPTNEEQERIRCLGPIAVDVLAGYVKDENSFRQFVALRLLGLFKDDKSITALEEFATNSSWRLEAVLMLCSYPEEKVRPFLEKRAKSDHDVNIRDAAKRYLREHDKP